MATKKTTKVKPLSSYEEDLIYMAYRYAIGRHTIHSHSMACDMIRNEYYRFLLNPNRMIFTSKDINRSIEDILRWHEPSLFITNYNQANVFPYELYMTVWNNEEESGNEFNPAMIKKIEVTVDDNGDYVDHTITYNKEENKLSAYDMTMHDLEIWNIMAKLFDLSKHKTCTLKDNTECEYVDININREWYKIPIKETVSNPYILTTINDDAILK